MKTWAALTRWGEVLLVEPDDDGAPGQTVLFGRIEAPPDEVFRAVSDVTRYNEFIDTMDRTRVLDRRRGLVAYRWVATVPPLVRMDGIRLQRTRPPHLVEVRGHSGHLRGTRERYELHAVPGGTLLAMYRSLDIETGHLLMRTIASIDPSMKQGINLATLLIHFKGLHRVLDADADADAPERPGIEPLPVSPFLDSLEAVLDRGTLIVMQSTREGRVRQVMLTERIDAPADTVRSVIRAADRWPEFIESLASQTKTATGGGDYVLDWKISIPLGTLEGRSRMREHPDGALTVDTVSGDIRNGQARWAVHGTSGSRSILVHHSYSDLRDAAWILRLLLDAEPFLEHGISGAAGALAVTRMGARAEALYTESQEVGP